MEINRLFKVLIETIDLMLNTEFYNDTTSLVQDKAVITEWYDAYKNNNRLNTISIERLVELDNDISDIFNKYIEAEPISHNYVEILDYYFCKLKRYWKDDFNRT